ncbi:NAD(P)H-binding protein [Spiractinospora alimapuensis]|uniref:SDR family oxidoreductase n=1 Tax=Spiractinospora alimapuensis TaxID=2820884 RepID=UPI001F312613|nr:NAD(P)H-binding protein [Spiractinospora alimapuensis]QVQ52825.1 NAD(P)H-binding protein [Spiractinospora alimapuensis]
MESVLVTGGTGTLGREVVRRLAEGPHEVRVLTRRAEPGGREPFRRMVGDLSSGTGLTAAVDGAHTIVHCATTNGRGDVAATRRLVDEAGRDGARPHVVYVSIVGVDRIRLPYYQAKLAAERVIVESGVPWTILRATQFHDLLASIFAWQRLSPVTVSVRNFRFQPIDNRDVAARLAELVAAGPAGRAPDIGGPKVVGMDELARTYNAARGRRRPVVPLPLFGTVAAQFAAGHNLAPGNAFGTVTFQRFLAEGGAR